MYCLKRTLASIISDIFVILPCWKSGKLLNVQWYTLYSLVLVLVQHLDFRVTQINEWVNTHLQILIFISCLTLCDLLFMLSFDFSLYSRALRGLTESAFEKGWTFGKFIMICNLLLFLFHSLWFSKIRGLLLFTLGGVTVLWYMKAILRKCVEPGWQIHPEVLSVLVMLYLWDAYAVF